MMYGGWIGIILFLLIIYLVFNLSGDKQNNNLSKKDPIDILNERYANGEISEEEYIRMKKIIRNNIK